MITVVIHAGTRRDEAEAESPVDAIFAARTMFDELCDANPYQGFRNLITTTFAVDGKLVRVLTGGQRP